MFRCPSCGQAHKMEFTNAVLTQNEEMTKVFVNGTEEKPEDIQFESAFEVECQDCHKTNKAEDWMDAFQNPLNYFEMEQLCHCGGELWMDKIPGTSSYGFVCDKCEWVKPNEKVSGA